ncbi:hypothetical protein [Streptomyces sp. NPDC010273]|uniref:hypothetical protein n=1 Tax=Streptomyces sp. NPDC010273 TaxID=3364829 RepID=UPI0036ED2809
MRSWQDFGPGIEAGFDTTWIWEYYSDLSCRDGLLTAPINPQGSQTNWSSTQSRWWHDRFPLLIDHDEEIPLPPSWSPEPRRLT